MGSSRGFGSAPRDRRPIQTRFRCGSGYNCLNLPRRGTRRIILQKARRQATRRSGPPTAWKHTISGSISLPSPGYFSPFPHGTLRYRSLHVACLGGWSPQFQTGYHVSGPTQGHAPGARPSCPTRLSRSVAACSKRLRGKHSLPVMHPQVHRAALQPRPRKGWGLGTRTVWASPGSFATTTGVVLSSSGY